MWHLHDDEFDYMGNQLEEWEEAEQKSELKGGDSSFILVIFFILFILGGCTIIFWQLMMHG